MKSEKEKSVELFLEGIRTHQKLIKFHEDLISYVNGSELMEPYIKLQYFQYISALQEIITQIKTETIKNDTWDIIDI